jgi:[acyl-carrier-protein] S-malonyltransferase
MPQVAFLFAGQGAQSVGMAQSLVETVPAARALFAEATEVLGYDLLAVCKDGPAEQLNSTAVSQPAIFVASLAALEALKQTDPAVAEQCVATAGLSLGEYTALVFAGVLSFRDGLALVQKRGQAMQAAADATPSGMVSVLLLDLPDVQAIVEQARSKGTIAVANLLCPGNTVVSGVAAACDEVERLVTERKGRCVRLAVAGAFHTAIMRPADQTLAAALAPLTLQTARVPVWSNVDAQPHTQPEEIRKLLVQQVLQPVRWEETLRGMLAQGVDLFYELGPGRVIAGLLKRIHRKAEVRNVTA